MERQKGLFRKLAKSSVTENKSLWETVKPLFSYKVKSHRILKPVEKDKLIYHDENIAQLFDECFANTLMEMSNINFLELHLDEVSIAIIKHKNHTRIKAIKNGKTYLRRRNS